VTRVAVGAIVRRDDEVLLVAEGAGDETVWALPGGVVEADESVPEALMRKVTAETGLTDVQVGPLLWVAQYEMGGEAWVTYGFEARSAEDHPGWVGAAEAVERLSAMWFPPLREPAVRYLEGRAAVATLWTWARLDEPPELVPASR
jgi:ADP-ribose pyrophosphatase YjhB (NUDIX family)